MLQYRLCKRCFDAQLEWACRCMLWNRGYHRKRIWALIDKHVERRGWMDWDQLITLYGLYMHTNNYYNYKTLERRRFNIYLHLQIESTAYAMINIQASAGWVNCPIGEFMVEYYWSVDQQQPGRVVTRQASGLGHCNTMERYSVIVKEGWVVQRWNDCKQPIRNGDRGD